MNRLVIIGNGFDLAHGLPTGYCDFIDWYWTGIIKSILKQQLNGASYDDEFINITFAFKPSSYSAATHDSKKIFDFPTLINFVAKYTQAYDPMLAEHFDRCKIGIKNSFFGFICNKRSIQNWVDIENEYYKLLKDCLTEDDNFKVKKLNEEFEQVKELLEEYLDARIDKKFNFDKPNEYVESIIEIFKIKPRYLSIRSSAVYDLEEFAAEDRNDVIEFDKVITELDNMDKLVDALKSGEVVQNNLFLNFNYTKTLAKYIQIMEDRNFIGQNSEIQIHGTLKNRFNKVNFGFGDEMDDEYKLLEKKNDNEYLKNIKSFQYLQNSNYRNMLDFIDSEKFQVFIMGHSCGLSDRILLNTIFEHQHCRSIKVFYHEWEGGDNYTDIVQNISRHFNKKKLMRDKLVNKAHCRPLPQQVRFQQIKNYFDVIEERFNL